MPVQRDIWVLSRALLKLKLPYAIVLAGARKCIIRRQKSHIPPGLLLVAHPVVVLRLLWRLLQSAHLNYAAPLRQRWAMPWELLAFGCVHSPHILPGLRPPLSSNSHVLPQCCKVHLGGCHIRRRARLQLAAPIPQPHHLWTRGATPKLRGEHHNTYSTTWVRGRCDLKPTITSHVVAHSPAFFSRQHFKSACRNNIHAEIMTWHSYASWRPTVERQHVLNDIPKNMFVLPNIAMSCLMIWHVSCNVQ